MGFIAGRRRGMVWEDAKTIDEIVRDFPFHTSGHSERDFEQGFTTSLMREASKGTFNNNLIAQIDRTTTVKSIFCFGKHHRPDATLNEDGIAIELKFVTYAGLRDAIGQGHLYRLRYKFVFLILIIDDKKKNMYEEISIGKEKNLEDMLKHLAETMNIFTYIVPAFKVKTPGIKKCIPFFYEYGRLKKSDSDILDL